MIAKRIPRLPAISANSSRSFKTLQRKCACGGSAGLTGECAECQNNRLLGKPLQTKLRINQPGDEYEREADRVGEQIMRMPELTIRAKDERSSRAPLVQRRAYEGHVGLTETPSIVHGVLSSSGQPLDAATRTFFEPRFRHDFGQVRVHLDSDAAESARSINAEAYTVGQQIVFGARKYAPDTRKGRNLLAHELTHVLQQDGENPDTVRRQEPKTSESAPLTSEVQSLMKAAGEGNYQKVEELMGQLNPNITDDLGWTALLHAADAGHPAIVKLLLERGANIEFLSPPGPTGGWSPLKGATIGGHPEVVKVLLKNGASLYAKDRIGWSAPIWAAREGQLEILQIFLKRGLDINYRDDDGLSLLMHATEACQVEMVKWLIAHGARVDFVDIRQQSALGWAEKSKEHWEWKAADVSSQVIPNKEEYEADRAERERVLQSLLKKVADCEEVLSILRFHIGPNISG